MKYLLSFLFAARLFAASWYVDPLASGAANGTSWASAWTNPTNVVWASVNPGDTIYVSGGTTSQTYTDPLYIMKSGTAGNYITVKIGQEAGHNGVAIFNGTGITHYNSDPEWLRIDGGRSVSFAAPTNHQQVIKGGTAITNNIGFRFKDIIGNQDSDASPVLFYFRKANHINYKWIEVSGMTNNGSFSFHDSRGTVAYGTFDNGELTTNVVFEYMYCHDNGGQVFSWGGQTPTGFGDAEFRFLYLPFNSEDHFETSGGVSIHDSVIGPCNGNSIHNDHLQFTGSYIKVYNNDIRESANSVMRVQTLGSDSITHDVWFFNNLVTEKIGRAPFGGTVIEPICFVNFDPLHPASIVTYSNIIFANNLFYNSVTNTISAPEISRNPTMYWSKGYPDVTQAVVKACLFVNNLFIDKEKGVGFATITNSGNLDGYNSFTTNDFVMNYNTFAATNTFRNNPIQVTYRDLVTNAPLGPYAFLNRTNYPLFVDKANDNFELLPSDNAVNSGFDVTSYFNFDALNRPRKVGSAVDRGPLEQQETNIIVWLTFNGDPVGGNALDSSGNGNDGVRFRLTEYSYPSNRLVSAVGGTLFRTNNTADNRAAEFLWRTNNGVYNPLYLKEGGYFAITNVQSRMTAMSQCTVALWARYNKASRTDLIGADYSQDANAALLSAGTSTGSVGSWDLGRFNQGIWINNTRMIIQTNADSGVSQVGNEYDPVFGKSGKVVFNYPDRGYDNDGDTTNWYHYAFTFSNGVCISYFNGVPLVTNDISAVTNKMSLGRGAARPYDWIGVGVNTHVGTPELEDEPGTDYPNNGFMNGGIDDVLIMDRALTGAEIVGVYTGTFPASSAGTGSDSGGSSPNNPSPTGSVVMQGVTGKGVRIQ